MADILIEDFGHGDGVARNDVFTGELIGQFEKLRGVVGAEDGDFLAAGIDDPDQLIAALFFGRPH